MGKNVKKEEAFQRDLNEPNIKVKQIEERLKKENEELRKQVSKLQIEVDFITSERNLENLQKEIAKAKEEFSKEGIMMQAVDELDKVVFPTEAQDIKESENLKKTSVPLAQVQASKDKKIKSMQELLLSLTEATKQMQDFLVSKDDDKRLKRITEGLNQTANTLDELKETINENIKEVATGFNNYAKELIKLKTGLIAVSREIKEIDKLPVDEVINNPDRLSQLFDTSRGLQENLDRLSEYIDEQVCEGTFNNNLKLSGKLHEQHTKINGDMLTFEEKLNALQLKVKEGLEKQNDPLEQYFEECESNLAQLKKEWNQVKEELSEKSIAEQVTTIGAMRKKGEKYKSFYLGAFDRNGDKYFRGEADKQRFEQLKIELAEYQQEVEKFKDNSSKEKPLETPARNSDSEVYKNKTFEEGSPKTKQDWFEDKGAGSTEGQPNLNNPNNKHKDFSQQERQH